MSLVKCLKKILPMNTMFKIKYRDELRNQKFLHIEKGKHIFFLDAPDYGNIGDQAIAYAIKLFAEKTFSGYQFVEVLQKDVASYLEYLKKIIQGEDIIFLIGGGNMGNYYRIYEATRRLIIRSFKNNQIVIFPQSIMYSEDLFGKISLYKARKIYNSHPNLLVCAREEISYEKMRRVFNNVILCPDIVLSLANYNMDFDMKKKGSVGICLRDDIERILTFEQRTEIERVLSNISHSVKNVATVGEYEDIDKKNRDKIVIEKINQIAKCNLLVTDRLHAMIFAIIARTPCLVFDNNNSKISGTVEWLADYPGIKLLHTTENFELYATQMIESEITTGISMDYSNLIQQMGK